MGVPMAAVGTLSPGAYMSMHSPQFEDPPLLETHRLSCLSNAATVMTPEVFHESVRVSR